MRIDARDTGYTMEGYYTAPDATTGLVGVAEPPEGSTVTANSLGVGDPAIVKVTRSGVLPIRPTEIGRPATMAQS